MDIVKPGLAAARFGRWSFVVLAALLSACSGSDTKAPSATSAPASDGGAVAVTSVPATYPPPSTTPPPPTMAPARFEWLALDESILPFSDIAVAGELGWLYAIESGQLYLLAIDETGDVVHGPYPASKSYQSPGLTFGAPLVVDGEVFYYSPSARGPEWQTLTWRDADTGDLDGSFGTTAFDLVPADCGDHQSVCFRAWDYDVEEWIAQRLEVGDGSFTVEPDGSAQARPERLLQLDREGSMTLLIEAASSGDQLTLLDDGAELWRRPVADLFPAPADGSYGWSVEVLPDAGIIVGWLGMDPTELPNGEFVYPAQPPTVAISIERGELIWSVAGNNNRCGWGAYDQGIICVLGGPLSWSEERKWYATAGSNTVLERVDLQTGTVLWSVDLGAVIGLRHAAGDDPAQGHLMSEFLVETADGFLVIDFETGASRAPGTDEVFWCTDNVFDSNIVDDEQLGLGTGSDLRFPCSATFAPLPPESVEFAPGGVQIGDTWVIATPTGLIGLVHE